MPTWQMGGATLHQMLKALLTNAHRDQLHLPLNLTNIMISDSSGGFGSGDKEGSGVLVEGGGEA